MKKILYTLLLSIFGVMSMSAQHNPWDISLGGKLGANYGTLTTLKGDPVITPTIAATIEMSFSNKWGMAMEVGYKRYALKNVNMPAETIADKFPSMSLGDVIYNAGSYDYSIDYIDVNYFLKYYTKYNLNLYAGLKMGRMLHGKVEHKGENTSLRKNIHHGNFSVPIGAEYEYKNYTFDVRYEMGIQHLAIKEKAKKMLGSARTSSLTFTVGYRFQLM
ncbi:MAG: outer membrane beta-barrel protein [Prevotella sp.]|nr:outer membrane beta-barrel protein [Prevotella sp.]